MQRDTGYKTKTLNYNIYLFIYIWQETMKPDSSGQNKVPVTNFAASRFTALGVFVNKKVLQKGSKKVSTFNTQ